MVGFLDSKNRYYEGDQRPGDRMVSARPSPFHTPVFNEETGEFVSWREQKPAPTADEINKALEGQFLSLIPKHLGKPYLTDDVILGIGSTKQVVTDYIALGLFELARKAVLGTPMPEEMHADRDELLKGFPQ